MTELVLVRHAETELAGRFCGWSDPPVNARGEEQIDVLVQALAGVELHAVYSSDLERARCTAARIAEAHGVPLSLDAGLREIDFGRWEGLSWSEIEALDEAYARRWVDEFPGLEAPGGEHFAEFKARVLRAVSQLRVGCEAGRAAVVTHGGVMRVVLTELCGATEEEAWAATREYCSMVSYPPGAGGR